MACDSKPRDFREKAERSLEATKLNKDNYFKSKPVINEREKKSVANREAVSLEERQVLVTAKEENRPSQEEVEDMRFC